MATALLVLLAVICVLLCTGREPDENARTWTELWTPAREKGWLLATLLGVGGTLKLLFLLSIGLIVLALRIASPLARGFALVCESLAWHLREVAARAATPPPRLISSREVGWA